MLTVGKLGVTVGDGAAALRAARYVLELADAPSSFAPAPEEHWSGAGPTAVWLGSKGALGAIGVEQGRVVEAGELALALQGRHGLTGGQVRRPGARSVRLLAGAGGPVLDDRGRPVEMTQLRTNSVALTLQMPKSVSIAWAFAGPELRAAIERATLRSAQVTADYLVRTKPVVGGKKRGRGFAASAALHVVARQAQGEAAPSPHLHVHLYLVGVEDDLGRLRSPDTGALFKDGAPLEGGAVWRLVLAEELRWLGFQIDSGTGRSGRYFEIRGVPEELVRAMSGRAREVEEAIAAREARRGASLSPRERAVVALETRAPKDKTQSSEATTRVWKALGEQLGFGGEDLEALIAEMPARGGLEELRTEARKLILKRIRDRGPTVSIGEARAIAYEVSTMGLTLAQANDLLRDMQRSGELIALEGERVTTSEIRALEQRVMRSAANAARRRSQRLSKPARKHGLAVAERSLGEGRSLLREQRRAVAKLNRDVGWATLTGLAGTGKGPVLEAVAHAHLADGWKVIACAVDGPTKERLGHQVGAEALSIDQLLVRVADPRSGLRIDERTLILVDEAGKVGAEHWAKLAELVERAGARLRAVGHTGQLGAIVLAGMFEAMLRAKAIPKAVLGRVLRHRDPADPYNKLHPWLGDCQAALDAGKSERALKILRENDAITMHRTRASAAERLVREWDRHRRSFESPRDAIMVVNGSNKDVDHVNELAQERRLAANELLGEAVRAVGRGYGIYAGDVVMLRETSYRPARGSPGGRKRVENGTTGIVLAVDVERDRVKVRFDEPAGKREVVIDQRELRRRSAEMAKGPPQERQPVPALRLAYAFHPFPLQGATAKYVGVLAGHWSELKEAAYVAITRAAQFLHVHTDRESLGVDGSDADRWGRLAQRWKTSQHRLASILSERLGTEIAVKLPAAPTAVELVDGGGASKADAALEVGDRSPAEAASGRVSLPDSLLRYRRLLGERRWARIERAAEELAEELARLDDEALEAESARREPALAALDGSAALAALRIERDQAIVQEQVREAVRLAERLEARALAAARLRRRERRELREAAKVQRDLARRADDQLGALVESEHQLRRQGRHLDDWSAVHGDDAVRWVGAQRELAARWADPSSAPVAEPAAELAARRDRAPERPEVAAR